MTFLRNRWVSRRRALHQRAFDMGRDALNAEAHYHTNRRKMNTETPLVDAAVNDTALEDKNQPHTDWITADAGREIEKKLNEAVEKITDLEKKLAKWESELSSAMPPDFKDWHENSKEEWPEVARSVIVSLREREAFAFSAVDREHRELVQAYAREAQLRSVLERYKDSSRWILEDAEWRFVDDPKSEWFSPHELAERLLSLPTPPVVPADQHEKLFDDFDAACEIIALVKRAVSDLPPHIEDCINWFAEERELKSPEAVPIEDVKPLAEALKQIAHDGDDCCRRAEDALSAFTAKHQL